MVNLHFKKLLLDKSVYKTSEVLKTELFNNNDAQTDIVLEKILDIASFRYNDKDKSSATQVGKDLCNDIELVETYKSDDDKSNTVASSITRVHLKGSRVFFKDLLMHPYYNIELLTQRQALVKDIGRVQQEIDPLISTIERAEKDVLWLFEDREVELTHLYDMVFFSNIFLKKLNTRGDVLSLYNNYRIIGSPLVGVIMPIVYFVVPFLILKFKFDLPMTFATYIRLNFTSIIEGGKLGTVRMISYAFSLIFYFQGLFNSIEVAKTVYNVSKLLAEKIRGVVQFIQASLALNDIVEKIKAKERLRLFFNTSTLDIPQSLHRWSKLPPLNSFSLFTNYGNYLTCYKSLHTKEIFPLLIQSYMIDAVMGVHRVQDYLGLCFPEYVTGKVYIEFQEMYHPCLVKDKSKPVSNDLILGEPNCAILTGPNAGGKSTLLKSTLIAVMLAQTIGVSTAKFLRMTPFKYINSQINIPDCKGKESLFEAEMYRCKQTLDVLHNNEGPSFVVMDEIFNSTNPIEGIAGAYAILKKLGSHTNNVSIISTHYLYLTKLCKELPDTFKPIRMNVVLNIDGSVETSPFKVQKGVSKQCVALELLKSNGFDAQLIEDAITIKKRLTTVNRVQ